MSNDLKLALKITADLNDAKQQLQQLSDTLNTTSQSASNASDNWREYAEQSGKNSQQKEAAEAAVAAAAALEEQRVAVTKLLSDIDPLEKKLNRLDELEQRLNASFKAGAIDVETYNTALGKINNQRDTVFDSSSIDNQRTSISKLLGVIDPLEKKLAKIDDLELQLTAAFKEGRVESERYQSALKMLNDQRAKLTQTTENNVVASDKSTKSLKTSSRELSILTRQLSSGSFGSASTGFLNIAQRAGVLPPILGGVGLAFTAVTAAGAGLYSIVKDINTEQLLLNQSIQITGNYAGITAGQINQMAASLKTSQSTLTGNREIIAGLNETGQFTGKTLAQVSSAAVAMSELTGKSANETISQFSKIKDNVTAWALETNRQYHFLDLATYQRINALEQQGRTEEAIELASARFTEAAKQRTSELTNELNWLQKSLNSVGSSWEQMKNNANTNTKWGLGLETDDDKASRLRAQQQKQAALNQAFNKPGDTDGGLSNFSDDDKKELQRLEANIAARQQEAAEAGKVQVAQEKAIVAQKALNDVHERQKTDIEKQNEAILKLTKNYQDLWATAEGKQQLQTAGVASPDGQAFKGGQYDKDIGTVKEQYPDKLNQQFQQRLDQLKTEADLSGKVTREARVRYETESGGLKKLTTEQKTLLVVEAARADKNAALLKTSQKSINATAHENERYIDSLTKQALKQTETAATIRVQEINTRNLTAAQREQAIAAHETLLQHENIKKNQELQIGLFKLQGKAAEATAIDIENRYTQLFKELEAQGNFAGLAMANSSKQLEIDKLPLIDAQRQLDQLQSEQSRKEQLIQAQQQAGQLSRYEASQKLLEIQKETRIELEKQLPLLEQAAIKTGDPAIIERLSAVRHEMSMLSIESNEWVTTLQSGIDSGLNTAFNGLITRSQDLSGALTSIAQSVVNSFAQMASQNLSSIISTSIGDLFSSGTDAAQETATAATAAAQYSAAITTSSAAGAASIATSLSTSGTAVATTISAVLTSGSAVLSSTLSVAFAAGAAQIAAAIAASSAASGAGKAAGAAVAAATGGLITGPGTGTSDSIPARLSNGEYVIKQAAVSRYGADFLHAVNNMRLRGFAEGGLVAPLQSPTRPSYSLAANGGGGQPAVNNNIQQTLVLDPNEVLKTSLQTANGQKSMITFIHANRETLRQELGVNN